MIDNNRQLLPFSQGRERERLKMYVTVKESSPISVNHFTRKLSSWNPFHNSKSTSLNRGIIPSNLKQTAQVWLIVRKNINM